MSQSVTVTGMILSASPIGENDKRIVILTKEKERFQRLQKGQKTEQPSSWRDESFFLFGEFVLYEGRSSL